MPPPASNHIRTALGQDGSDWSCDLATLTFDLGGYGACSWCGSSSSIRTPSLKFVGFAVQKIWHTMCVSINGLVTLTFDLEIGLLVASKLGNLPSTFGLWVLELFAMYVTDRQTDRRTDESNAYCPIPTGGGIKRNMITNTATNEHMKLQTWATKITTEILTFDLAWCCRGSWPLTSAGVTGDLDLWPRPVLPGTLTFDLARCCRGLWPLTRVS